MKKKYLRLTDDQKSRGVIFSSRLIPDGTIHEVLNTDTNVTGRIELLLDDKFFNNSPFKYNEVRQ